MAGIYQRDNRQALLANALQNARNRREAAVARDEQRRKENFKALGDTMKAPTAATEILPQNRPTTTRSAALNNSCSTLVRIMGMV